MGESERMLKKQIITQLQTILKDLGVSEVVPHLEIPSDLSHGDYTTNVAFQISKQLKKSPMEIATKIKNQISKIKNIEKVEAVEPGFVNFWIEKKELINYSIKELQRQSADKEGKLFGKKILVEYAHPNTHKEMHIGHMRTLITGEALSRLFESQGAKVFRANYQGDIGPHVAKALYGAEKIMEEKELTLEKMRTWSNYNKAHFLGEAYVRGNRDYEYNKEEIDHINKILYKIVEEKFEARNSKFETISNVKNTNVQNVLNFGNSNFEFASDFEIRISNLYFLTRQWSLDYYDEFYTRFMTKFDYLFLESQMVESGVKIVKKNVGKIFTENDGAVIFPGENYGLHTRVFITQGGYPTYEGKEMGNAFAEYKVFAFDKKIHVVGSEQSGYFQVVFKALELLDPEKFKDKQYHVPMGMVQLSDRKMSSRTGDILRVDWLIDQVKSAVSALFTEEKTAQDSPVLLEQIAIGAIKYSVLKVGTTQNVVFDIQKSVSLEGNSGPYIQYTHARTQSILRKAQNVIPTKVEGSLYTELDKISQIGNSGKTVAKRFTKGTRAIARRLGSAWNDEVNDSLLYNKSHYELEEYYLLRQLYQFTDFVQKAAESYSPNVMCEYLFTLAQEFNLFYQKYRIIDAPTEEDKTFRLFLTDAVGEVLKEGLGLLGIAAPGKM